MSRYRLRCSTFFPSLISAGAPPRPGSDSDTTFYRGPGRGNCDHWRPGSCGGDPVVMRHAMMRTQE